jgi:hypothetical protein
MAMCLETVDGERFSSSMSWHKHNSPFRNAIMARTRCGSLKAFAIVMQSRIECSYTSPSSVVSERPNARMEFEPAHSFLKAQKPPAECLSG